jgi:hypothetical protein
MKKTPKNEILLLELLENFWEQIVFKQHVFEDLVDNLYESEDTIESNKKVKNVLKCIHKIFQKSE